MVQTILMWLSIRVQSRACLKYEVKQSLTYSSINVKFLRTHQTNVARIYGSNYIEVIKQKSTFVFLWCVEILRKDSHILVDANYRNSFGLPLSAIVLSATKLSIRNDVRDYAVIKSWSITQLWNSCSVTRLEFWQVLLIAGARPRVEWFL